MRLGTIEQKIIIAMLSHLPISCTFLGPSKLTHYMHVFSQSFFLLYYIYPIFGKTTSTILWSAKIVNFGLHSYSGNHLVVLYIASNSNKNFAKSSMDVGHI